MSEERANLSRPEFAQRVGLSVSEIRRKESLGLLTPARRARYNTAYYGEKEVALVLEMRRADARAKNRRQLNKTAYALPDALPEKGGLAEYNKEDACAVFAMLQAGERLDKIVTALSLHPQIVRVAAADFAVMSNSFVIRGHVMEQINKLPLDGVFPIESDEELLEILKTVSYGTCTLCKSKPRSICRHCAGVQPPPSAL